MDSNRKIRDKSGRMVGIHDTPGNQKISAYQRDTFFQEFLKMEQVVKDPASQQAWIRQQASTYGVSPKRLQDLIFEGKGSWGPGMRWWVGCSLDGKEETAVAITPPPPKTSHRKTTGDLGQGDVKSICHTIADQLAQSYNWAVLPPRFRDRRDVRGRWGRVGVEFGQWPPATEPGLLMGLLLDGRDQRVTICDGRIGVDLYLALDVGQTEKRLPSSVIRNRAAALKKACPLLQIRADEECRNYRQILTVQEPISNVVDTLLADATRTLAIYQRLYAWCHVLFADGTLEAAIDTTWR